MTAKKKKKLQVVGGETAFAILRGADPDAVLAGLPIPDDLDEADAPEPTAAQVLGDEVFDTCGACGGKIANDNEMVRCSSCGEIVHATDACTGKHLATHRGDKIAAARAPSSASSTSEKDPAPRLSTWVERLGVGGIGPHVVHALEFGGLCMIVEGEAFLREYYTRISADEGLAGRIRAILDGQP